MPVLYLEKRIPALNQKRFYTITVTLTLFGSWAVVREWGWIGPPGTVREMWFETEGEVGGRRAGPPAEGKAWLLRHQRGR